MSLYDFRSSLLGAVLQLTTEANVRLGYKLEVLYRMVQFLSLYITKLDLK